MLLACALGVCSVLQARGQQHADLTFILGGLAARTQQYYDRFISIICTETIQKQNLRVNLAPAGRPRTSVYELSVSRHGGDKDEGQFRVERTLQSVDGRAVRKGQTPECTDPKTGTPEPLEFLLAGNQSQYRFALADSGDGPSGARALDFVQTPPEQVRISWAGSCFEAQGGGHHGRVWFDPASYDVLRVDVRLSKPFLVPLPAGDFGIRPAIRVERSEMSLRFSRVEFQQPDEVLMLPHSIESLHVLRGVASLKIQQTLANYRRFLTQSEIRP